MSRNKNNKQRENMNKRIDQYKLEQLEPRLMMDNENGLNDQLESIFQSVNAVDSVTLNQSEINFETNQNPTETLLNLVKGNLSNLDLSDLESLTVDNIAQKINGIEGVSAAASSNMLTISGEQNVSFGLDIPTTGNDSEILEFSNVALQTSLNLYFTTNVGGDLSASLSSASIEIENLGAASTFMGMGVLEHGDALQQEKDLVLSFNANGFQSLSLDLEFTASNINELPFTTSGDLCIEKSNGNVDVILPNFNMKAGFDACSLLNGLGDENTISFFSDNGTSIIYDAILNGANHPLICLGNLVKAPPFY